MVNSSTLSRSDFSDDGLSFQELVQVFNFINSMTFGLAYESATIESSAFDWASIDLLGLLEAYNKSKSKKRMSLMIAVGGLTVTTACFLSRYFKNEKSSDI